MAVLTLSTAISACTKKAERPKTLTAEESQFALIGRGRSVYMSACLACHSSDPTKPGTLGPELAGASKELIEARVLRNDYPKGYSPKRNTRVMIALPHLKNEIDALAAYLGSLK